MLVASKRVLLLDEISTGLDSSTTYQICRCLAGLAHLQGATVLASLLQPPPETFALFDDVILLAEGGVAKRLAHEFSELLKSTECLYLGKGGFEHTAAAGTVASSLHTKLPNLC